MDVEHIQQQVEAFHMYAVNLLVDNTNATGAPIIFEDSPPIKIWSDGWNIFHKWAH